MSLQVPTPVKALPPEGTAKARCYALIHVGTYEDEYQGSPIITNKIRLSFELPEETHVFKEGEDAKPFSISQEFTMSLGEKSKLRPIVEGIIGRKLTDDDVRTFDLESLVEKPCLVTVQHKTTAKGSKYAMIATTSPLMKGQTCPPQVNPTKILTYEKWDEDYFDTLPDFIKEKMAITMEFKKKFGDKKPEPKGFESFKEYPKEEIKPEDIPF